MNTAVQDKQEELVEKQQAVKETQQELKHECRKELNEEAETYNESMQQVSRVTNIIGTTVKNYHGDNLGDIQDLVVNPESGHIVYAVVAFGGVFGIGDKLFAIPWQALHWNCDKAYYIIDVDKAILENAPGFDKNHWPDSSSKWHQQREELNQFYRVHH